MEFYGALFGWTFDVGPEEYGRYTTCLLDGRKAAALTPNPDPSATEFWWNVYLATDDLDATVARALDGGWRGGRRPVRHPGRRAAGALLRDTVGAQFGLWQGSGHIGCEVVNEPGALIRNDLVTPTPEPAREFYVAVFDFTLDRQRRTCPRSTSRSCAARTATRSAASSATRPRHGSTWNTVFEVADTDEAVRRARDAGGKSEEPSDMLYGRIATVLDPFGTEFSVITRAG